MEDDEYRELRRLDRLKQVPCPVCGTPNPPLSLTNTHCNYCGAKLKREREDPNAGID